MALSKLKKINLPEGVADGKVTQHVMKCHKCLYCGAEELKDEAYDNAK